ncbi:putative myb dna-binding domain protein [Erysiphe neolycopersici]|uniref:Putative myb dna-binding domain protein n=1 Tax=Erysiphe neolycopersici TaxID=212602 RepID=A0A420HX34_9PEZI|nr:putative myb dna-binding domain protein [Erysiphe neolycopersici]
MITRSKTLNQSLSRSIETSGQHKVKTRRKRKHVSDDQQNEQSTKAPSRKKKPQRGHEVKKPVVILSKTRSGKPKKSKESIENKDSQKHSNQDDILIPERRENSSDPLHNSMDQESPKDCDSDAFDQNSGTQKISAIENLLDLMGECERLFHLLGNGDISKEKFSQILHSLELTESPLLKSLQEYEKHFHSILQIYGPKSHSCLELVEIQTVLSENFGIESEDFGQFRPDALFYASNTISLTKELLKLETSSQATTEIISFLYESFPKSFIREFSSKLEYGNSTLETESFNLSLEIRTQFFMSTLRSEYDEKTFSLNYAIQLLVEVFLHNASTQDVQFEDFLRSAGTKETTFRRQNSFNEAQIIKERVQKIYSYLKCKMSGENDLIIIQNLSLIFPWSDFLTSLIKWGNLRVAELFTSIKQQGGIGSVVKQLLELQQNTQTIARNKELLPLQPNTSQLIELKEATPVQSITPLSANQSLLSLQNIIKLQAMKNQCPKKISQSNEIQVNPSRNLRSLPRNLELDHPQAHQSQVKTNGPLSRRNPRVMITQPYNRELSTLSPSELDEPTPEKNDVKMVKEKFKLPGTSESKNLDPQNRNTRSSPSSLFVSPAPELSPQEREDSVDSIESSESIEKEFEEDKRNPDPTRRMLISAAQQFGSPQLNSSPPKQATDYIREESDDSLGSSEDEGRSSHPTISQISTVARQMTAQSRMASSGVQIRIPWSHNDEKLLLSGIEKYGCSWSSLSNIIKGWDRKRDQVALKDKARNMKVSFLKAGVPLPKNFHKIRLGKKEIASVRTVIPDYNPDEY